MRTRDFIIGYYGRKRVEEELLWVPSNFYIYSICASTVISYDPNDLENLDYLARNIASDRNKSKESSHSQWGVSRIRIPIFQLRCLQELCFKNASEELIIHQIFEIFHGIVTKLDYLSMDRKSRRSKR